MKMFHESATSCSVDGQTIEAGKDGAFEVPDHLAGELISHGFTTTEPEGKKAPRARKAQE